MEILKHVKPSLEYKEALIEYIEEHEMYQSHMNGSGGLNHYKDNIEGYLERLKIAENTELSDDRCPSETYMLIREYDNRLIGMINIRKELNARLKECGGHIGYGIRPTERRKGYNKINLYLGIKRCQELGINMILLDCDKNNIGSYKTMEALGGILIKEYSTKEHPKALKYAIDTVKSLALYKDIYEKGVINNECNRSKKSI